LKKYVRFNGFAIFSVLALLLSTSACGKVPRTEPPRDGDNQSEDGVSKLKDPDTGVVFRNKAAVAEGQPAPAVDSLKAVDLFRSASTCSDGYAAFRVTSQDSIGSLRDLFDLLLQPPESFKAIQGNSIALAYKFSNKGTEGVVAGSSNDKILQIELKVKGVSGDSQAILNADLLSNTMKFRYESSLQRKNEKAELSQKNQTDLLIKFGSTPALSQSVKAVLTGTDAGKPINIAYELSTKASKLESGNKQFETGRVVQEDQKLTNNAKSSFDLNFVKDACTLVHSDSK
jgi:hypothetical protein